MSSLIFGTRLINLNDETFRAWGLALSNALSAMLARVPQANDIDWLTVSNPLTSTYATGSEVYRLNDALHSTHPVFLKFEYATAGSANRVRIRLTVGKGADGNGNITGILQAPIVVFEANATAPAASNSYISNGDGSGVVFSLQPDIPTMCGGFVCIERSRNSSGQATGDALLLAFATYGANTHTNRFIAYNLETALAADATGLFPCPLSLATDVGVTNGTVAQFFPVACIAPNGATWRSRMLLGAARQNASLGQPAESILFGENYIGLGAGVQRADQRSGSYATYMIWWS